MKNEKKIIFSIKSYNYLLEKILENGDFERGEVELKYFPDGERYQRIISDVSGRHVVLLGGTISDSATLELYDLGYSLVKYGALSLTFIIPYFGYSTMERAVEIGEVVTAKTRANLLSSLPKTSMGNRFLLMDLHTEGIPYYFEGAVLPIHVYCKPVIMQAAKEAAGLDFILGCTDAGRAKWVQSLANDMAVNAAFLLKRRVSGEQTEVTSINADVEGKSVVIYDDMIRSGSSLINAGRTYKDAGADKIYVITTHGLFIQDGLNKMKNSGLFEYAVCTDTHPNAVSVKDDFLKVISVGGLLASELNRL
jgi:ribose-phosphate pyrophosphokinase